MVVVGWCYWRFTLRQHNTDPLIDISVLQLDEASLDGGDEAVMRVEGHPGSALGVLELCVQVDARVRYPPVQTFYDQC